MSRSGIGMVSSTSSSSKTKTSSRASLPLLRSSSNRSYSANSLVKTPDNSCISNRRFATAFFCFLLLWSLESCWPGWVAPSGHGFCGKASRNAGTTAKNSCVSASSRCILKKMLGSSTPHDAHWRETNMLVGDVEAERNSAELHVLTPRCTRKMEGLPRRVLRGPPSLKGPQEKNPLGGVFQFSKLGRFAGGKKSSFRGPSLENALELTDRFPNI